LSCFAGIFVCIGISLYFAYFKMDELLKYLENCPAVLGRAALLDFGFKGRLFVLGGIIAVLDKPAMYVSAGGADVGDLERFPADLRRNLLLLYRFMSFFVFLMFGLYMRVQQGCV
jgi:hypothetical protein